jgi:hypothetical protein
MNDSINDSEIYNKNNRLKYVSKWSFVLINFQIYFFICIKIKDALV